MILQEIAQWIVETVGALGYPGIFFLMFLESSFFPFPSEVVVIPGGYLAAQGELSLPLVVMVAITGSLLGAIFNYYLAFLLGRRLLLRYGRYFFVTRKRLLKVDSFFSEHGEISTFVGRLIPGLRQYISFPAGLGRMNLFKFSLFTALGGGLWVLILAYIGYFVGNNPLLVESYSSLAVKLLLVFSILLVAFYLWNHKRKS